MHLHNLEEEMSLMVGVFRESSPKVASGNETSAKEFYHAQQYPPWRTLESLQIPMPGYLDEYSNVPLRTRHRHPAAHAKPTANNQSHSGRQDGPHGFLGNSFDKLNEFWSLLEGRAHLTAEDSEDIDDSAPSQIMREF
ncbi:MAG: hypothetical protein Q9200_002484 [Gallowayella weberi]